MNNVLYHLHPVKVKRHGVRLSYTLCLGGLSFFLFILLTITGIFLSLYYRPTVPAAYADIEALSTSVAFGSLVRNMRRWGLASWCSPCSSTCSRVFYHGAYKPPREFNWVVGVVLLLLDPPARPSPGTCLPWDQLALLGGDRRHQHGRGYAPVFGDQVSSSCLLGGLEVAEHQPCSASTCSTFSGAPVHHRDLHGRPLLAGPQRRRDLGTPLRRTTCPKSQSIYSGGPPKRVPRPLACHSSRSWQTWVWPPKAPSPSR